VVNLFKLVIVVALLGMPFVVISAAPRFFELLGAVPAVSGAQVDATPTPGFKLTEPAATRAPAKFGALDETPPPTLSAPAISATAAATPRPTATGERITIGNTGGVGAVLRADPVTGTRVATLHEQQVLDVLERRTIPGSGVWVRVRTAEGVEGWVTGVVALPIAANTR
jgi:hypothetical protein